MISLDYNQQTLLIGKAVLIAILGVFVGFILKTVLRKYIDSIVLKKIFSKDASIYETSNLFNKILTEALMWIIIVYTLNYSLTSLGFNFLEKALNYFVSNVPNIATFVLIISAGVLIAKLISSNIKDQDIENKNEIIALTEIIIIAAFFLSSLEFIGIKATALIELYKVILYIIGTIIVILIVNPKLIKRQKKEKK